jgi:hypothetical protein
VNIDESVWLISAELFMFIYVCHITSKRHHGRVAHVFPSDSGGLWFLSQPMEIACGFPQLLTAILGSPPPPHPTLAIFFRIYPSLANVENMVSSE